MKRKLLALLMAFTLISGSCIRTFAATDISPTNETFVSCIAYDIGTSSTDLALDGTGGLIIASGQHASFLVNATKAGYYKLLVYGKYVSTSKPTVTVSGVNGTAGLGISTTTYGRYTLGRYYLNEGSNSIVLTVTNGTINIIKLYLKSVERNVGVAGITKIEAHDYYSSDISTNACEDIQWQYASANTDVPVVTGPVVLYTGAPASQVKYKLNIEQAGSYRLKLYGAKREGDTNFALSVGNTRISQATVPKTLKFLSCMPGEFDLFNLKSGAVEITVKEISSTTADPIFCFWLTMERVGDMVPLVISETAQTILSPQQCFDIEGTATINTNSTVALNVGQWISYDVNVTKPGNYKFLAYGTTVSPNVSLYVDDVLVNTRILGGSTDYRNHSLGRVNLTAGTHKIKFLVNSGTVTVTNFIVKCVDIVVAQEGITKFEAEDYLTTDIIEQMHVDPQYGYPTSINTNTGAVYLDANKKADYSFALESGGMYKLTLYAAYNGTNTNRVVTAYQGSTVLGNTAIQGTGGIATVSPNVVSVIVLNKGLNTIRLQSGNAGEIWLYYLELEKVESPGAVVAIYDGNGTSVNAVTAGEMIAKVALNGFFEGENVFFCFAIYKTDEAAGTLQLYKLVCETVDVAKFDTLFEKGISGITLESGFTYTTKVFIWSNMKGKCFSYPAI